MRLTERLRGLVGRGTAPEEISVAVEAPTPAAPPPRPTPPPPQPAPPAPAAPAINLSVEAAYAMLQAFPKDTDDAKQLQALRSALATMADEKKKTLQQLLAEVLQEKARIALALQSQEQSFEAQVVKISEAVDALWERRDKLTEHHQRLTLHANERIEGLDSLIQCLSLPEVPVFELTPLEDVAALDVNVVPLVEEGPVVLSSPSLPKQSKEIKLASEDGKGASTPNRRRLYAKA